MILVVLGTDCTGSCKCNYYMITTTTDPTKCDRHSCSILSTLCLWYYEKTCSRIIFFSRYSGFLHQSWCHNDLITVQWIILFLTRSSLTKISLLWPDKQFLKWVAMGRWQISYWKNLLKQIFFLNFQIKYIAVDRDSFCGLVW
jgi:hypothetical protein